MRTGASVDFAALPDDMARVGRTPDGLGALRAPASSPAATRRPRTAALSGPLPGRAGPARAPGGDARAPSWSRAALHPAWVVIAGVAAALARVVMHSGLDTDVFWHLAAGQWMLSHHAVIRRDVFSYTVRGHPWFDDEWGFQVLLAGLVHAIGNLAFWLVPAGSCVAALAVSLWRWRSVGASWTTCALLSLVAGGGLALGDAPRPQVISYLLFACELALLGLARGRPVWLVALPPLFFVWANVHGSFLLGLGALALETARSALLARLAPARAPRPSAAAAAAALGASATATFLNPHGPRLLAYVYTVATSPQLARLVEEWQSPNFHSWALLALVLGPVLLTVALASRSRRSLDTADLVLWAVTLLLALRAQRFVPYLCLAWCNLAAGLALFVRTSARSSRLSLPAAVCLAGGLLVGPHVPAGTPAAGLPVAAAERLQALRGRVFSTYGWDDYLIHLGIPVFVDGRTDLYFGTGVLEQWVQVAALRVSPDPTLARWDVRYVLWPAATPLAVYLTHDTRWVLLARRAGSDLFERRTTVPARADGRSPPATSRRKWAIDGAAGANRPATNEARSEVPRRGGTRSAPSATMSSFAPMSDPLACRTSATGFASTPRWWATSRVVTSSTPVGTPSSAVATSASGRTRAGEASVPWRPPIPRLRGSARRGSPEPPTSTTVRTSRAPSGGATSPHACGAPWQQ